MIPARSMLTYYMYYVLYKIRHQSFRKPWHN